MTAAAPAARSPSFIAEIPAEERPRERLLKNGAKVLSDAELLAVVLRRGRPGACVLEVARELLAGSGGLVGLTTACARSLQRNGVGEVKLATILAAVELGRRLASAGVADRVPLSRPWAVAEYLGLRYSQLGHEILGGLYVDARHRLMGECELYRGSLHRAAVEPRAIFREGLLRGAAGVVMFHTRPSGDPAPSWEDVAFTRRVARAGEVIGVELVDHLVIAAGGRWVSLKERGGW